MAEKVKIVKRVAEIYDWLDEQIRESAHLISTLDNGSGPYPAMSPLRKQGSTAKKVDSCFRRNDKSRIRNKYYSPARCRACGDCCDFEEFDHRLFVTPPELVYLASNLGVEDLKPMSTGRCPYNVEGKCSVYEYRFAGCRIFSCSGHPDFQSRLSETALEKFKAVCTHFQVPYRYTDLPTALNKPDVRPTPTSAH